MCPQGSLFEINKCACVTVSCLYLPHWPPARGKSFKGARFHLGEMWVLPSAQNGALSSFVVISTPLPVPLFPKTPHLFLSPGSACFLCLHSLCESSFPLRFYLKLSFLSFTNAIEITKLAEAESRMVVLGGGGNGRCQNLQSFSYARCMSYRDLTTAP